MQVINFGIGRVLTQVVGILILLLAGSAALAKWPIGLYDQEGKPTLAPVLKRVTPAVVNVSVETAANSPQIALVTLCSNHTRFLGGDLPLSTSVTLS